MAMLVVSIQFCDFVMKQRVVIEEKKDIRIVAWLIVLGSMKTFESSSCEEGPHKGLTVFLFVARPCMVQHKPCLFLSWISSCSIGKGISKSLQMVESHSCHLEILESLVYSLNMPVGSVCMPLIWIHIYHQQKPPMLASIYPTYGSYGMFVTTPKEVTHTICQIRQLPLAPKALSVPSFWCDRALN